MSERLDYRQARGRIADGDLVAVMSRHGALPLLTRLVTGSPYTHTAIALWLDGGLWAAEMGAGGNVLVPLSRYEARPFEVYEPPGLSRLAIRNAVTESLRGKIPYDVADLARIALWRLARLALPAEDRGGLVCSAYSARVWRAAGWRPARLSAIPAPDEVVAALGARPKVIVNA